MRTFLLLLAVLLSSWSLSAQPDTLQSADTKVIQPDTVLLAPSGSAAERVYIPKRALLWSIIPGGGQVYNRRWWKLPLVYGVLAGVVGVADYNQSNYKRFQRALDAECFGQIDTNCQVREHEFTGILDVNALRRLQAGADRARQLSWLYILGAYALQGIEAYVDSHLRVFDIDDDIGMRVRPTIFPQADYALGLRLVVPLGGR